MADLTGKAISELPAAPTINDTDLLVLSQNGASKKITPPVLLSVVEGEISGLSGSLATYARPNLLDNWYFVGGGSQLGDGVFPINQRGQGSYEPNHTNTFLIDRWSTGRNTGKLQLHTASMSGTNDFLIEQSVGSIRDLGGKTLTISILTSQGLFSSTDACPTTAPTSGTTNLQAADIYRDGSRVGYADVIVNSAGNVMARIRVFDGYIAYFLAIKLELGDTQTLAHQEGNTWVLNEIPDYAEQLAKCQRYYQRYGNAQAYRVFAIGYMQNNTSARFFLPLSVPMVRKPTATVNGTLYFNYGASSNRIAITFDASAVNNWDDHQVFLAGTTASSVEVGTVGEIMSQNTTVESIELSAE